MTRRLPAVGSGQGCCDSPSGAGEGDDDVDGRERRRYWRQDGGLVIRASGLWFYGWGWAVTGTAGGTGGAMVAGGAAAGSFGFRSRPRK